MEKNLEAYTPPTVTEAGDFTDVTLGLTVGPRVDGGTPPNAWRCSAI
ncbi:lasso RiPP family leader peptide-containing protein [Streptomyces chrestomyceticus]